MAASTNPPKKVLVPVYMPEAALQNPTQWRKIRTGGAKTSDLLSIRDIYEMCLVDCDLLKELIRDFDGTLSARGLALYDECYRAIKDLIEEHRNKGLLDDLIKAICEEKRWSIERLIIKTATTKERRQGLRPYGMPKEWDSACPWADCPP